MSGIRISSNNFNGKSVEITFNPFTGGTIDLGTQTIPYDYLSSNYEGNYSIYIPEYDKTCPLTVGVPPTPSPTPTSSVTPTQTPTQTGTPTPTPTQTGTPTPTPSPSAPSLDPDAAAYLADVVTSGGTTNPTIEAAVDTLFTELKSNGLYSKMLAMYPYVGSTAASHSINALLNKTYDITWNGGMTHGISGSTGNGTNGYGNTNFGNDIWAQDDISFGIYQVSENVSTQTIECSFGTVTSGSLPQIQLATNLTEGNPIGNTFFRIGSTTNVNTSNGGNYDGNYIATRTGSTEGYLYRNTNLILTNSTTYTKGGSITDNYVFNVNVSNAPFAQGYANQTYGFTFMGEGLSASEVSTLDGIINTFQTSLGRNTY